MRISSIFDGMLKSPYIFLAVIGSIFIQSSYASVQDTAIYDKYEIAPEPVGGKLAYIKWLDEATEYTDSAITADVRGTVVAEFVVERNGDLSHIQVRDTLGFGMEEALRKAIATSAPWRVAIINGRPVRARYQLPIQVNARLSKAGRRAASADRRGASMPEIMPEPPGGQRAFMQWVGQNYRVPPEAVTNGVSGTLELGFIVEADGTITQVEVLSDLGHGTGAEAVRILKRSPRWSPGILNGRPVRVHFKLPIKLSL